MKSRILVLFLFVSTFLSAQPYGNEWINYAQKYYQIKIAADGLYRIDYQTILNANIPLSTINPANFQLFAKGKQQPIYIKGEADGTFDPLDYIEFYGQRNDGWLDTVFYKGAARQPNPYYSLINDTLTYYLTWNSQINNSRYQAENAIDFANYFPAKYVWKEEVQSFNHTYYDGKTLIAGITDPEYVETEGYMQSALNVGRFQNYKFNTSTVYTNGPTAQLELKLTGESNWAGLSNGDHHLKVSFANQQYDRIFEAYQLIHLDTSFAANNLNKGNNTFRVESIDDLSNDNARVDRMALAYLKLTYPSQLDFSNQNYVEFQLDDNGTQGGQYLELKNFNGGTTPVLYDLTNEKRIRLIQAISEYKTIVPDGGGRKRCILVSASAIQPISKITPLGNNGTMVDYQTQVSDSFYLIISHKSLLYSASNYAAHRRANGLQVLLADVDQLYAQYGYGIEKNPLAIRNFMAAIDGQWIHKASQLFLLGKSVAAKEHRKNAIAYAQNLVPTFGNPAADNLLTAGLGNTFLEPLIPQGRLSAKNNTEVNNYLAKVVEYENATTALWMKQALHFAGGNSAIESNRYENYLNSFAADFENVHLGGNVKTFQKSTTSPYQTSLSDSIRNLINNGVALMTFFGHASATGGFDISIDAPDKLKNRGKYPVILANSCFSGNYHQANNISTGEAYVLEKEKGAIGFIANGSLGLPYPLSQYSGALYKSLSKDNYGNSWAAVIRDAVKKVASPNIDVALKGVCLEMGLQGDPALKYYSHPLPDYKITAEDVKISPTNLSTALNKFTIQLTVENIGRAIKDSIAIQLKQKFPLAGVQDTAYTLLVPPIYYKSEVEFTVPIDLFKSAGINEFTLLVDPLNEIPELSELNNRYDFKLYIRSGEVLPVYPINNAIIGKQNPILKASTVYAFEEERQYVFELDTTPDFNSSWKSSHQLQTTGGLLEWKPTTLTQMQDSLVYFWRLSKAPKSGQSYNWMLSSFQYIPNETGWAQSDFSQYEENEFAFLKANKNNKKFEFVERSRELYIQDYGRPTLSTTNDVLYRLDADVRERNGCGGSAGFFVAVLDSLTLDSWETPYMGQNPQNYFGQANADKYCGANRLRPEKYFLFRSNDSAQMVAMRDFLNIIIPDSNFVVIYTWFNINYSDIWNQDSSILKAIENLGSVKIRNLTDGYPIIFTAKKGQLSSAKEVVGDSTTDRIELSRTLTTTANYGKMTTSIIGPSQQWNRLYYDFSHEGAASGDSIVYKLNGIKTDGSVRNILSTHKFRLDTALTSVNDSAYQYLNMEVTTFDEKQFTPPQLKRWQLNFQEGVDFALAPNLFFEVEKDSVEAGEFLKLKYAVALLSSNNQDSLKVEYKVVKSGKKEVFKTVKTYAPVPIDSFKILSVEIPTQNLSGTNSLQIIINPENKPVELNRFNNEGQYDFYVFKDHLNPLIDVIVDGRHIMNGEIVSSKPEIVVSLKDENNFLALDDTSSIAIFLTSPDGHEFLVNYIGAAELRFIPAQLPDNKAKVIYQPQLLKDGTYRLRIQAKDKTGNASPKDYQIEFEVINRSTVTHLLNYPNPFSTSTAFVFTLTGSRIPDQVQIQIMTITGKVVREIDQFELGPIHIGNNITKFKWNGKDAFGDQLANGIYLYRVKMKMNGQNIEHRETNIDKYFKKEFGKMYLLR